MASISSFSTNELPSAPPTGGLVPTHSDEMASFSSFSTNERLPFSSGCLDEFFDVSFSNTTRSLSAAAPLERSLATGLPIDLNEISSPASDIVQEEELTKALGDVLSFKDDGCDASLFDHTRGVTFQAARGIFASQSPQSKQKHEAARRAKITAPPMVRLPTPNPILQP
jgi:hypothetical protein